MIERRGHLSKQNWRVQRRTDYSNLRSGIYKIIAIIIALLIAGIALWLTGRNPLELGWGVIKSTLGTGFGREQLLILATPLIITGLVVTLAGRINMWNMGAEGQLYIGAWAATGVGLFVKGPDWFVLLLMFLAAGIAAGLFAFVPAWMRVKTGISEILSTILLNYVAVQWVIFFAKDIWRETSNISASAFFTFRVPQILPSLIGKVHIGFLIAVILVIVFSVIIQRSIWGYEITSIGNNKAAARYAGIKVNRQILFTFTISGAIAGIAGFIELSGVAHRLSASISHFYGWDGLVVSMLAGTSFLAIIPYGLFMALLLNGGIVLQTQGLTFDIVQALIGLILLLSCIGELAANYRIVTISPTNPIMNNPSPGQVEIPDLNNP